VNAAEHHEDGTGGERLDSCPPGPSARLRGAELPAEGPRNRKVQIMLNDAELAWVTEQARALGLTRSTFLRMVVRKSYIKGGISGDS
jgi:hypothetical protein